ncbi:insulinase family protein [Massilia sp. DJPM01]|uniref:M16 family metallopeptidase n=1 Tax=Massilia sp. DJPM01 TaxID=3024404 RepID=UPI00259EE801|nr:M16 family metallopeptidase [Massilia sp. DJPM01]MDM5177089.1 insulinase family protein [Massilia sp. DJPM01]
MTKYFVRSACAATLLMVCVFGAQAAIKPGDAIPVGPQVKVGKLANGLTYYIQNNAKPAKKLELRLVVKAGSILEDEDQQGLAHFTEHMAFNGSTNFKKHELVSYLQSIGVKFGADLNAYTSFDETVYILPIPTDNRDNIDKGFLVLQDWAGGLTMNAADIDKERGIILEELRLGKGANDRMNKVLMPKLYNGSLYARRLPIGQERIIKHFKHEAIRRFYKDWYRPDLMAVVVVGDIDPLDAQRRIERHFGQLKNPARARARTYAAIPTRAHTEALVVTDKEATANALLIRYPVKEAIDKGTFGAYREKLVEALFTGMLGQRMQELAQQADPPFMAGSSSVGKLTPRYNSFNAVASLGKGGATPAIEALVQENARTRQFGFSAQEFERARKNMMRHYELAYNERDKTDSGSYVSEYVRNFLEQESIPGIENEYAYVRELLPAITLDDMNRYAHATIPAASAKLVVYMGSAKDDSPAPTSAQLLAAVAAAEKATVSALEQKTLATELMDKPPAGGSIVAQSEDKALGLTKLTLSNGVKVILKPTDFRNDEVVMSAARFGGQTQFGEADIINARYANAVVGTMGLKDHSPLDLQKVLAGKTATVNVTLGNHVDGITGSTANDDMETMLQLVYLRMTGVRRDEGLYKSFIGKQVEAARNAMAQPESVFRDTLVSTLYQDNPRVGRTARPGDFDKLDLERALAVYRARFFSAKDMTFILVGSFDMAKVKPLLATYLGALPVGDIEISYKDAGVRPVRGVVKKEVRSGSEAKSSVSLNFSGEAPYSDDEAMRFQAMLEVINIRITDILREKLALIYGGGMSGSLSKYPYENYLITAALPTGPANVDKVIAAAMAEIARMKEQGPDLADLNKVKQNWLQNHQKSMRENGYWINRLQTAALQGSDPHEILAYPKKVEAIMPEQLKQAARRYFDMNNYVQLVLYPEK